MKSKMFRVCHISDWFLLLENQLTGVSLRAQSARQERYEVMDVCSPEYDLIKQHIYCPN